MAECLWRKSSFFEDYNRCMPWHNIWWSYGIHIHQWGSYLLLMWTKMWKRCTERRNLDLERKKLLLKKETWEQAQIPLSLLLDRMKTQWNPKGTAWGHLKSGAPESDKHVYASKSEQEYEIHSLDGRPIMDSRKDKINLQSCFLNNEIPPANSSYVPLMKSQDLKCAKLVHAWASQLLLAWLV